MFWYVEDLVIWWLSQVQAGHLMAQWRGMHGSCPATFLILVPIIRCRILIASFVVRCVVRQIYYISHACYPTKKVSRPGIVRISKWVRFGHYWAASIWRRWRNASLWGVKVGDQGVCWWAVCHSEAISLGWDNRGCVLAKLVSDHHFYVCIVIGKTY